MSTTVNAHGNSERNGCQVRINIVSGVPPEVWDRELPPGLSAEFVHTRRPVVADWHVIYGLREELNIPNVAQNVVFVASEPPEIRRYNTRVLNRYGLVMAPGFPYLSNLSQYAYSSGLAPWWVGVTSPSEEHYEGHRGPLELTRDRIVDAPAPTGNSVSVIVSTKSRTPWQTARLRLVDYLSRHLDSLAVYGVGHAPVDDKATVLSQHRYHLAVENSQHAGYWTEKLADPILMGCAVFYGGHPSVVRSFPGKGIELIDPTRPEQVYRKICLAIENDFWSRTRTDIRINRKEILERSGLHREVLRVLDGRDGVQRNSRNFRVPPHHPPKPWKRWVDPVYRGLRSLGS